MVGNRPETIADDLLLLFPIFRKRLMKGAGKSLGRKKPSSHECPVLGMLIARGPLPMSEVGERLCISKPNVTAVVDKLVREGKVDRHSDESDRRIVNISVTDKGRRFMHDYKKTMREVFKANLSQLGDKDLNRLCAALEDMKSILSKINEDS